MKTTETTDVLKLIENFEGIIGAVLGVAVTLVLTTLLKNVGKLTVYPPVVKNSYYKQEALYGSTVEADDLNDAENVTFDIDFDLYNSSETMKVLREVQLSFYKSDEFVITIRPDDNATKRHNGHWIVRDGFTVFNLQPKCIEQISLHVGLSKEETNKIKEFDRFELTYKTHKNKLRKLFSYTR